MDINIIILIIVIIVIVLFLLYKNNSVRKKIILQIPESNIIIPQYDNTIYYPNYGYRKSSLLNKSRNRRHLKVRFTD